jgi:phosphopantetheinyl transferase
MPLVYYHSKAGAELGLWQALEPEQQFREWLTSVHFPLDDGLRIVHAEKRLQWMASRYLMCTLYPGAITRYADRKPYLFNGPHISISHSRNMVGVMLGEKMAGLDLQWPDPKLRKVAPRFASEQELAVLQGMDELWALATLWAIKEAIFKHYGTGLPFRQIVLKRYDPETKQAAVQVLRKGILLPHNLLVRNVGGTVLAFLCD